MGRLSGSTGSGRLGGSSGGGRLARPAANGLNTPEGLASFAEQEGFADEAAKILGKKTKMSFLQRLSSALGAFNPAEAILTGQEQGGKAGVRKYLTGVVQGIAGGITGTNYQGERRMFADVAEKMGVENAIAKFGLGLAGDILLDPSTFFGGAIANVLLKGATKGGTAALGAVGRIAPKLEAGIRMAGEGAKEAAGRAFVAGYKSSEGALEDTLTFLSKRDKAKLGLAQSNLNRLGTRVLTEDQQAELAVKLVAGKRAEFEARQLGQATAGRQGRTVALEGLSPELRKVAESQMSRSQKFGKQLGLADPYESYFPFIKKDKLEVFLKDMQRSGLRVGSEGYRKQFRNLLKNENIELDPSKAFFTSEASQVSDRMTRNFLKGFVKKYGKPLNAFEDSVQAEKAGFQVLKEKGIFGKEIGYTSEHDARLIKNLITPEFQTLNMLAKSFGFDALTNLFKRSVTGLFLPFHIRNFVSGIVQNYEVLGKDALSPKAISSGQKIAYLMARGQKPGAGTLNIAGKEMSFRKVFQEFSDRFGSDTFYQNDFLNALENGQQLKSVQKLFGKESFKETARTAGLGSEAIPFRLARTVGQFIEHQQKATVYVAALNQGKTIKEALKMAERAGFDYRALTSFESQVLRRIIPFYSFTRKNIELQLRTLKENPQRINQIIRFFENAPELFGKERLTEEEKQALPTYLREAILTKLPDTPDGLKRYISNFGTPVEQFAQLFGGNPILRGISMTNPLIKVPLELGFGKDSFRQKDLKEVYDAREYKMAPQIVKDLLDIKEKEEDILKRTKSGKYIKTGKRTQYVADPVKLLIARSLFTSRGVTYLDQLFGGDLRGLEKVIKTTTGVKTQQYNLEALKSANSRKIQRELEDMLTKYGATRQFTKTYVPKK